MTHQKGSKAVVATGTPQGSGGTAQSSGSVSQTGTSAVGQAGTAPAATKAPTGFRLKLQQMLAGIQAVIPDGSSLPGLQGAALAKADIVSQLGSDLGLFTAVDNQELVLVQARSQLTAAEPAMHTYYQQLKNSLITFFGKGSPQLAQFGLSTKVFQRLSPTALVARAAKLRQTRALRNTQGSKQKAAVQFQGQVAVSATVVGTAPSAELESGSNTPAESSATAVVSSGGAPPGGTTPDK